MGDEASTKTLWPTGYAAAGLFFAAGSGLELLRGRGPTRVVLCEGLTDTLAMALHSARAGRHDVAVLGGTSGSWGALSAVPWPPNVRVVIATDLDPQGERYAETISRHLHAIGVTHHRADWRHHDHEGPIVARSCRVA